MFSLHVELDENVKHPKCLADWELLFKDPNRYIVDEYGEQLTPEEILEWITERSYPKPPDLSQHGPDVELGPNNLLRLRRSSRGWRGPADGAVTYQYSEGDFS